MKIGIIALAAAVMVITGSMAFAATSVQTVSVPALEMSYNGQGGYGHGGYGHGGHGGHSGICW